MEITQTQSGDILIVKIRGRLDGYWADDISRTLLDSVREGAHDIRLDCSEIDYMSSIGLGALIQVHRQLSGIHGSFAIINPSKTVKRLLELSGVDKMLMAGPAISTTPVDRELDQPRVIERPNALLNVVECSKGANIRCRIVGRPDLLRGAQYTREHCTHVELPQNSIAIGLGALGEDFVDCSMRFGEFIAAAGSVAYQPTDGSGVPDHMMATGTFVPSIQMLYGLICEGNFSHAIQFQQKKEAKPLTLSGLAETGLEITQSETTAMLIVAESAGLLGAWLRQSPALAANASFQFHYPEIREWLSFASERTFHRSMVVVAGIVTKSPQVDLMPLIRPLWRENFPSGHFHAASFTFRPLKKGETDSKKVITTLFAEETLQGVLHLLSDDREAEGSGQSEFVRGICWASPVSQIVSEGHK
jgi:anti-anti-sigma factor